MPRECPQQFGAEAALPVHDHLSERAADGASANILSQTANTVSEQRVCACVEVRELLRFSLACKKKWYDL